MSPQTIKQLQFFIGKVCSIVTTSMNRSFDEQISREHFVIRVQTISQDGIWGTHPYNHDFISFFTFPHIISIHQEIELDLENPDHADLIKQQENKTGEKLESDLKLKPSNEELFPVLDQKEITSLEDNSEGDATFIDITSLEQLAEQSKKTFDAQDYLNKKS